MLQNPLYAGAADADAAQQPSIEMMSLDEDATNTVPSPEIAQQSDATPEGG